MTINAPSCYIDAYMTCRLMNRISTGLSFRLFSAFFTAYFSDFKYIEVPETFHENKDALNNMLILQKGFQNTIQSEVQTCSALAPSKLIANQRTHV